MIRRLKRATKISPQARRRGFFFGWTVGPIVCGGRFSFINKNKLITPELVRIPITDEERDWSFALRHAVAPALVLLSACAAPTAPTPLQCVRSGTIGTATVWVSPVAGLTCVIPPLPPEAA